MQIKISHVVSLVGAVGRIGEVLIDGLVLDFVVRVVWGGLDVGRMGVVRGTRVVDVGL